MAYESAHHLHDMTLGDPVRVRDFLDPGKAVGSSRQIHEDPQAVVSEPCQLHPDLPFVVIA